MRTTIDLDDDVAAAVDHLQRRDGLGRSAAVNALIRSGLAGQPSRRTWAPMTVDLGVRLDVVNVAEALEQLDAVD